MMKRFVLALVIFSAACLPCYAKGVKAKQEEMCNVTAEKPFRFIEVPCSSIPEHPMPCYEEKSDGKSTTYTQVECAPGKQKTIEQVQREGEQAQKKRCGKDYQALRIGMTLDRFEECYEALSFVTETTTKNGVIETYQSTFNWIHAKNGRIISFTKRTH